VSIVFLNSIVFRSQSYVFIYNASVVNFYNATSNLARFENKNILSFFEKRSSLLQRCRCSCKFKSRRIGSCSEMVFKLVAIRCCFFTNSFGRNYHKIEKKLFPDKTTLKWVLFKHSGRKYSGRNWCVKSTQGWSFSDMKLYTETNAVEDLGIDKIATLKWQVYLIWIISKLKGHFPELIQ
jgi:hypothetical protein